MLQLSEEYLLSPCEIKTMENIPLAYGHLAKASESTMQIANPADKLPIIHCNTNVKINIFNSQLEFKILIGTVYLSTPEMLVLVDVQSAADYEKRNFFRIRASITTQAYLVPDKEEEKIRFLSNPQSFDVFIKNISLSGLLFNTPKHLAEDANIVIRLNLYGKEIPFLCKIMRVINPDPDEKNEYGCMFIEQKGNQFDLLCKYIFDFQREQIKKLKQQNT